MQMRGFRLRVNQGKLNLTSSSWVSVGVSIGGHSDELLVFVKNNEIGMGQLTNQAAMLNGIPLNEYSLL